MANVLGVSRSGYYKWKNRGPSKREMYNNKLRTEIKQIYHSSHGIYGSPKITHELNSKGLSCSRPRAARLMREMGLRSRITKKYKNTTNSKHDKPVAENILDRKFHVEKPNQCYISDITYLSLYSNFFYLTVVMDLFNREPIGWSVSNNLKTNCTIIPAFKMALKNRNPQDSTLFHSDRGIQYASEKFYSELTRYDFKQSMSRKGNCWDNAVMESFFQSLKIEWLYHEKYRNKRELMRKVFYYLEVFYARKRIHESLDYHTPEEYLQNYYKENK